MKLTHILAVAAAPLAIGGVLLTTAGQASAAAAPAVLTASVQQQGSVSATTHQNGVTDTTSLTQAQLDDPGNATLNNNSSQFGPIGPVWAFDTVERQLTATPDGNGGWNVTLHTIGSYKAFANPITGQGWTGSGRLDTVSNWTVTGANPSKNNLPAQSDTSQRSETIVAQFFGPGAVVSGGSGTWTYYGIPGAPGGVYVQH